MNTGKRMKTAGVVVIWLACGGQLSRAQTAAAAQARAHYEQALALLKESLDESTRLQAIALLEKSAELDPGREEVWCQLSWRYWMMGDNLPKQTGKEREARLQWFEKGQAAGEKALALNPKSVAGMYWFTVNLASAAEMRGILSSLMLAGTLFGNMSRVDRRDPYFLYGATRRFGSEVLIRVPTWLTSKFGFKHEYSVEDLEANIERWPHYFDNYVYLARVHWWAGEKDKALARLEFVLSHGPEIMPEEKAENAHQQEIARKMWREWTGKEYPAR